MKQIRVTEAEVLGDDMSTPFWQSIMSNPKYSAYEQDLAYILDQSRKHGKPFIDIDPALLDKHEWRLR